MKMSGRTGVSKLKEIIQENCPNTVKEMLKSGNYIYKGGSHFAGKSSLFILRDDNQTGRTSRNTMNFYTLFMDNLEEWEAYPKRNESFICTTNQFKASSYGDIEYVIPFDSVEIGVCSDADLWDSFPAMKRFFDLDSMGDFGSFLTSFRHSLNLLSAGTSITVPTLNQSWQSVTNFLDVAEKVLKTKTALKNFENFDNDEADYRFLKYCIRNKVSPMDALIKALAPETNGFIVGDYSQIKKAFKGSHEIWFSGKALIINENILQDTYGGESFENLLDPEAS